jgi:hypothetical protein
MEAFAAARSSSTGFGLRFLDMQYRKLIRQYGRAAVSGALTQANTILREWAERRSYRTRVDQRMVRDVLELSSRPGEAMNEPYRRS